MTRFNDILNGIKNAVDAAQKTYKGKKRSELKDSDFLFPETRSFPIVSPADIPDAISNFGRMKSDMSYDAFVKKLYNMAKRKGPEFVAALPEATKQKLGLKKGQAGYYYETTDIYPENEYQEDRLSLLSEDEEEETSEMDEYKEDFYEMSVGSIKSIMIHAGNILKALENPNVKNNLTETWLQGKIAVTEDYMITIHNFVMFGKTETDTEGSEAVDRPGLWENIRKKKEREGKKYRPAKPGDPDRPDPKQWKKLTK